MRVLFPSYQLKLVLQIMRGEIQRKRTHRRTAYFRGNFKICIKREFELARYLQKYHQLIMNIIKLLR